MAGVRGEREFSEQVRAKLALLDRDHDGKLSKDEVLSACAALGLTPRAAEHYFDALDTNQNGNLEAAEVHKSSVTSFLIFNFVISPLFIFIVCGILAGLLAAVEGWTYKQAFYFVACDVTGTGPFWSPPAAHELSMLGEIMEIIVSILAGDVSWAVALSDWSFDSCPLPCTNYAVITIIPTFHAVLYSCLELCPPSDAGRGGGGSQLHHEPQR